LPPIWRASLLKNVTVGRRISRSAASWLLGELPPGERPLVFTKCGLIWDQDNPMAPPRRVLKPESIRRECRDSMRRLGVERIDLLPISLAAPLARFQRAEPEPQSGLARRPTPDRATSSHHGVRGSGGLGAGLARRYRRHRRGPLTPAGRRLDRCRVPATDRSRLAGDFRRHRAHRCRRGPNDPAIGACRCLVLESGSTNLNQTLALFFLFTTPIIYLYLDRLQNRLVRPR